MSARVDTTTKLSYLLPTGTFLTFQVLAPLATNNGKCGVTEQVLTAVTLAFLVVGCVFTSFTDSYAASNGKVYNGILTTKGLWIPGYDETENMIGTNESQDAAPENHRDDTSGEHKSADSAIQAQPADANVIQVNNRYYVKGFKLLRSDYLNAAISAVAFLTLTMFTDPVSSCFYPHLSDTILKTLPVLLATVLSFCCTFSTKIRHGYGNAVPRSLSPEPKPVPPSLRSSISVKVEPRIGPHDVTNSRGENGL